MDRTQVFLCGLLEELRALPKETEWVEFKANNSNPEEIGEYISALSNAAVLCDVPYAYIVWGIDNQTHEVAGTEFKPGRSKIGNEEIENWLLRLLKPKIHFTFYEFMAEQKCVVLLEIKRASHQPVQFKGQEFIRIGSYKKKLKDFSERERQLWRLFDLIPFEEQTALDHCQGEDIIRLLDISAYFDLLNLALPENRDGILARLADDNMIRKGKAGNWVITNLGAILFAKQLGDFKHLKRKSIRVIVYKDNSRTQTVREQEGTIGYASGFEGLIGYINNLLPTNEIIEQALRKTVPMYPEIAVRELVANAIVHQDFALTGTGPTVEIFQNRIEITNPGTSLVETDRFLDSPPRSRNEILASFLRRAGICEERGSGIDKVVSQTELYQLPAPKFEVTADHTRAVLFAHKPFIKMDKNDRIRACYLHACLKYVNREFMTNASIRNRFGIESHNSAQASRIIRDGVDEGIIRPHDSEVSKKLMKYVPYWA